MDGTLTETNELIFASFNHVMQKYLGKTFTPQEIIALFGPPEEGGLQKVLDARQVGTALDELCEFYSHNHAALARLHDGVEEVLQFLHSKEVFLAVFTGKGRRTATITLDAFNLTQYFDLVVSGNDVVNHKPHPEGIQKILSHFSLSPSQAIMIGDGMSDVKASRAAGVKMGAAVWDCYDKERVLAEKTDFVFQDVRQLHEWFHDHLN
jgi:HAD superfamily hydrolase (TIGR01509 family)